MEFTNTFVNTCKENEWFIVNSSGKSIDFDKAEQHWCDECPVINVEDWTYEQYMTHMSGVFENHSWVISQPYPETTFKLYELIDYFIEIFTYGFTTIDESDDDDDDDESDDDDSDILSDIENDNESEHDGISAFASLDEIWEQHFESNTENAENAEITSEDWDNVRRQLDFDEEEEQE